MDFSATTVIPAGSATVQSILTDVGRIASWNPALTGIEGEGAAEAGVKYRTVVHGLPVARLTFDLISRGDIRYRLAGLGSSERGRWTFREDGQGTHVTHTFAHTDLLLALMRPAFAPVAAWRLERLRDQAIAQEREARRR